MFDKNASPYFRIDQGTSLIHKRNRITGVTMLIRRTVTKITIPAIPSLVICMPKQSEYQYEERTVNWQELFGTLNRQFTLGRLLATLCTSVIG